MKKILIASIFVWVSVAAYSQSTPIIAETQVEQQQRIHHGVRTGEITRREAAELQIQQAHIQKMKHDSKADGYVTPAEKVRIHKAQTKASRNIAVEKHDCQDRR